MSGRQVHRQSHGAEVEVASVETQEVHEQRAEILTQLELLLLLLLLMSSCSASAVRIDASQTRSECARRR